MKNQFQFSLIAACVIGAATVGSAQNLIQNGSFQTGTFADWTAIPVSYPMYIVSAPSPLVDAGDNYSAQIAGYSWGYDTLSQTVATTAGQSYSLSFSQFIGDGNPTTGLIVQWDGTTVYSVINQGPFNTFQDDTVAVPLIGTGSDTVEFFCANDPSETYLDNVSLVAVAPDGGTTAALLALALTGIGAVRRKAGSPR